jgi:hypothetical protein
VAESLLGASARMVNELKLFVDFSNNVDGIGQGIGFHLSYHEPLQVRVDSSLQKHVLGLFFRSGLTSQCSKFSEELPEGAFALSELS